MSAIRTCRLVKRKWLSAAFDGEGARLHGGRWNSRGHACIYLAGSESLALLEMLVHLDDNSLLQHYALLELPLPADAILQLSAADLPADWRDEPAPGSTARIGDAWLDSRQSPALAVPSVVVPREWNYLLNPAHSDFGSIVEQAVHVDFTPDNRL